MAINIEAMTGNTDGYSSAASAVEFERRPITTVVEAGTVPWVPEDTRMEIFENSYTRPTVSVVDNDEDFASLAQGVDPEIQERIMQRLSRNNVDERIRFLDDELRNSDSSHQPIRQGVYMQNRTYINGEEVNLMDLAEEGVEINLGDLEFESTEVNFFFVSFGPAKENRQVLVAISDASEQDQAMARMNQHGYSLRQN